MVKESEFIAFAASKEVIDKVTGKAHKTEFQCIIELSKKIIDLELRIIELEKKITSLNNKEV